MSESLKQKLIDLGPEKLAEALLNLALYSQETEDVIERLIATPKENIQRFKKKLSSLKRSRRFIDWRGSAGFARELELLLQDLEFAIDDPLTGLELVAAFYEADRNVFERCDDSSGNIGDVFRYSAKDRFLFYAARCSDAKKVAEIVLKLHGKDDYGVREGLLDGVGDILPEKVIRGMISRLQKQADAEKDTYQRRHHLMAIESLSRQIKDPGLFEKTRIASWGSPSTAAIIDIARVYLESEDARTAHIWLKKIPEDETYMAYDRNMLLQEIYHKQGNSVKLRELQYQNLWTLPSIDKLQALLDTIGHEQRESVLDELARHMLKSEELRELDAEFLIAAGKIDEAESYLLKHASQMNGNHYDILLSLAKSMESENRLLVSSLIYRSLLLSILQRGYQKAYSHGARYLKKLDHLAEQVPDWKGFHQHDAFKKQILQAHGRKRSFWSKYDKPS